MFRRCIIIAAISISFTCARSDKNTYAIPMQKIVKPGARKILIVSVSDIGGHASMVKALTAFLRHTHEVHVLKAEDLCRFSQDFGLNCYEVLQTKPIINYGHQFFHQFWQSLCPKIPMRAMNLFFKLKEFTSLLDEDNYSMVIFTSPVHINHINKLTKKRRIPSITIAADFGEPEPSNRNTWLREECDLYMCPKNSYFKDRNPKNKRLYEVSSIPVRPEFSYIRRISKKQAKRNIGVDPNMPCILVMTGAAGMKSMIEIAKRAKHDQTKTYIFICGVGKAAYEEIKDMRAQNLLVLKYVEKPMMYMRAADVLISKPGATSISEAIQCETACLFKEEHTFPFMRFLPTEEPTARYMVENEMGDVISEYEEVVPTINKMVRRKYYFPYNNALEECVYMIRRDIAKPI